MLNKKILAAAAVLAFLISGCTSSPSIIVKAGSAGDQTVTAKAGKTFSVQLEAQLSTGYSWKLIDSPASLITVKEDVLMQKNDADKTGGFEIQEFVFKSMEKGELNLTFKYAQHWKKKPEYEKTSVVKVRIE